MRRVLSFVYRYIFFSDYRTRYHISLLLWLKKHHKMKLLCFIMRERLRRKYHVIIGKNSKIGGILLPHPHNVVIGDLTQIGNKCIIYHDVTFGQNRGIYPQVGNNVIVYAGAKIIGNIKIGDNAIIGANAVVTSDVPNYAIVAGIPARVIGYRKENDEFC